MEKRNLYRMLLVGLSVAFVALAVYFIFFTNTAHAPEPAEHTKTTDNSPEPTAPIYDTENAASIQVVVNKQHPLDPLDYIPSPLLSVGNGQQLRTEAAHAFLRMQTDAARDNAPMVATSGYRSYTYQKSLYDGYVTQYGVAETDTFSARPGYSEHQTGLVVDIQGGGCTLDNCFADTVQGKWLAENAHAYGFILRYPQDKTDITGYQHEAWHWRYVGTELAADMHDQGIKTLEEYFDLAGGASY